MADIDKAIELKPKHADAYYCRGASYRELGQYGNAVADFDKAIILKPRSAFAYTVRGSSYCAFGEHRQALADLNKAIVLEPGNAVASYCRGVLYMVLEMYSKAIEDFNNTLGPNPTDYLANSNRNRAIDKTNCNTEPAKPAPLQYDKTIALKHSGADAYKDNRGYAYMKLKSYEPKVAIADYDRAIGLNPEYASAYFYRGSSYERLNEYVKAFEDYDKVIDLNPYPAFTAVAYFKRAVLYGTFREYGKAAADLEQAEALGCASEHIRAARLRIGI